MTVQYAEQMTSALASARQLAIAQKSPELFTIHLLTALSADPHTTFSELLTANGVDLGAFHDFALARSQQVVPAGLSTDVRPSAENVALMQQAVSEMRELGDTRLSSEHLLLAALKYRPGKGAWAIFKLSYPTVRASLDTIRRDTSV
ncbi:hypothetical protein KIH74_31130 [Kineosporia sp. J2-2]|uniref:Clp R domain-containing protein n=1 Tax=Kineosporia corallincola TaxID=2835133 RepID=A0ABS5TRL5_9ACTN|nr:Clp protease N-terminal domain-containing protein [Kineosporia corallincola]MBT0773441.1 hypothetical protein [Kineosporia corallincola]